MRKLVAIIALLAVIILSFGFVWLRVMAQGDESNYFNRQWRPRFAAAPWLREALGLHYDGDGRADYLGNKYSKILIEVDQFDSVSLRLTALEGLTDKIEKLTGKDTSYLVSDRRVPYDRSLTKDEIAALASKYRNHFPGGGDTATIYLLVGSQDSEDVDILGTTFAEYGIAVFAKTLEEFTARSPDTLANYELSTALHEFGHQLGLPHNDEVGCVMNEQVEEARVAWERAEDVLVDFCEYEKELIR